MGLNNSEWINRLSAHLDKRADHFQDASSGVLQELLEAGYDQIEIVTPSSACEKCQQGKVRFGKKNLEEWLNGLQFDAPLFEATHPDCSSCYIKVYKQSDPSDGKFVYRDGSFEDF